MEKPKFNYVPIDHHIYYTGYSFRVRVASKGITNTYNTTDKKKAVKLRDKLLKSLNREL